jgi:hypothetical protein
MKRLFAVDWFQNEHELTSNGELNENLIRQTVQVIERNEVRRIKLMNSNGRGE